MVVLLLVLLVVLECAVFGGEGGEGLTKEAYGLRIPLHPLLQRQQGLPRQLHTLPQTPVLLHHTLHQPQRQILVVEVRAGDNEAGWGGYGVVGEAYEGGQAEELQLRRGRV
jgi:hypothetical protein